jgi:hypothetical protein
VSGLDNFKAMGLGSGLYYRSNRENANFDEIKAVGAGDLSAKIAC